MSIGKRIKERRLAMNMSQRELAAKLGYSDHTTLTRIEADKVNLSESRIKQISSVLGVKISYLMGWEENPEEAGTYAANILKDFGLQEVLQNYMSLAKDDRELVNAVIARFAAKRKDQPND